MMADRFDVLQARKLIAGLEGTDEQSRAFYERELVQHGPLLPRAMPTEVEVGRPDRRSETA